MAYHFNNRISIIGITEEFNDEGGFIETAVNKRRQITNVTSIINA